MSVGLLAGCHRCGLAQHAGTPGNGTIGAARGTDTIPALACCVWEKTGIYGLGWETWGQEVSREHAWGRFVGRRLLSSHSLQHPSSVCSPLGRDQPGIGWMEILGAARGERGLPGMLGPALQGKELLPISCSQGGDSLQAEGAKACPQHTCPILGLPRDGSAVTPAVPSPAEGVSAWCFVP